MRVCADLERIPYIRTRSYICRGLEVVAYGEGPTFG